jgi:hypothetical protein
MNAYEPTSETEIFIAIFLVAYMWILLRQTVRRSLDVYDFLLLSAVAIVPGGLVFFPGLASRVARLIGVEFPLAIIFGALFLIVFVFLYRLVVRANLQSGATTTIVQDAGLLRLEVEELQKRLARLDGLAANGHGVHNADERERAV